VVLGYFVVPIKTGKDDYAGMAFLFQEIISYQKPELK